MAKAWGAVGNWALEAERAEAEARELSEAQPQVAAGEPAESFPSLSEAAATKTKKKKGVKLSLAEFVAPPASARDEPLILPTGPKQRSAEEITSIGGGFRLYGSQRDGGHRGPQEGFDAPSSRRPPHPDYDQPSKADESDNWTREKKFTPMATGRQYNGDSRSSPADEVDNWTAVRKSLPSRPTGFSAYRDSGDFDRWTGRGDGAPPYNGERRRLVLDPPRRDAVVQPVAAPAGTRPNPFGAARPREEVLREKGLDPLKVDSEIEAKRPTSSHSSRPSSEQSSRAGSPGLEVVAEGAPKAQVKVNPFGDAKPREVRLEEQGIDWRKLDIELEHRSVPREENEEVSGSGRLGIPDRPPSQSSSPDSGSGRPSDRQPYQSSRPVSGSGRLSDRPPYQSNMHISGSGRPFDRPPYQCSRPGSGSGRLGLSSDRPPYHCNRPGSGLLWLDMPSEESRSDVELTDRPSPGGEDDGLTTVEVRSEVELIDRPSPGGEDDGWTTVEIRRGFRGGRQRGFLANRNMDREETPEEKLLKEQTNQLKGANY